MLIDFILILSYLALGAALAVTLWAVWRMIRRTTREGGYVHGIATRRIALCLTGGVVVVLLLTFLLGSSDAVRINGSEYTDTFVLKSSDMLISTSVVLMVLAACCVLFSFYREAKQLDRESNILLDMFSRKTSAKKTRLAIKVNNETNETITNEAKQ